MQWLRRRKCQGIIQTAASESATGVALHAVSEQHGHQTQQYIQVWDMRVKRSVQTFTGKYQVLAVAFSDAGDQVRCGSHCAAASSSAQLPCIYEFKVTSAHA